MVVVVVGGGIFYLIPRCNPMGVPVFDGFPQSQYKNQNLIRSLISGVGRYPERETALDFYDREERRESCVLIRPLCGRHFGTDDH